MAPRRGGAFTDNAHPSLHPTRPRCPVVVPCSCLAGPFCAGRSPRPCRRSPREAAAAAAKPLQVGGLPVTCNLTLPVACVARAAANARGKSAAPPFEFEYSKYNGWPEIKESLMAGRIQAAYMLAPLVMDLADKKIPVKIVSLGHRSGAVIMVRTDSPYQHVQGPRPASASRSPAASRSTSCSCARCWRRRA